jgi:branched-chain amino acid transport system substrate-binding protein
MRNVFGKLFISLILIIALFDALYADSKFKVGVIAPLSGVATEYGVATKNGFELAIKHNKELFKNIEFVYEDSQYDTKVSLSAYRKLRQDPEIRLIYNFGVNSSLALLPIVEKDAFPFVAMELSSSSAVGSKYAFSFLNASSEMGKRLAIYLKSASSRKLAIVKIENSYLNDIIDGINNELKDTNRINIVNTIDASESNFRTIIAKLKHERYEELGVFLLPGQFSLFMQQMTALNYKPKIFGADTLDSKTEIEKSGTIIQNAIFASFNSNDEFQTNYKNIYENDVQINYAAIAYEFAKLTAKLFENTKPTITAEEIVEKYKNSGVQQGVLGQYSFAESPIDGPRFRFPVYLKRIKGMGYEIVE